MALSRYFKFKESNKILCECCRCKTNYAIQLTQEDFTSFERWENDISMMIQDALPNLDKEMRELFISGICGSCFNELFSNYNEEDEEDGNC